MLSVTEVFGKAQSNVKLEPGELPNQQLPIDLRETGMGIDIDEFILAMHS